jgi:CDP-diglyceride synthetase
MNREKSRGEISMGTILEVVLIALYFAALVSVPVFASSPISTIIFIVFAAALLTFAILLAIAGMIFESRHG